MSKHKKYYLFSDPVTLTKKLEPTTPDAEAGDVADSEDVRRFLSFLATNFSFHALLFFFCTKR